MKYLIGFLLSLCFLIVGCTVQPAMGKGRNFPDTTVYDLDGLPIYSKEYEIPLSSQPRIAIDKQTVFFECDPTENEQWKPQIYRVSLDKNEKPTLLFDGEMIGLFGSVLIACDDEAYYALRVDQKSTWKKLSSSAITTATVILNDELLLFGYTETERFIDHIDLTNLKSTREKTDVTMIDTLSTNGLLYYLRYEEKQDRILFCSADPATKKETVLKTSDRGSTLCMADNKILCMARRTPLFLYDPDTNTFEVADENQRYFTGGSFTKEENNSYDWPQDLYQIRLNNSKEYTVNLSSLDPGDIVAANFHGAAFLNSESICVIDWKTENIRQYFTTEL